MSKLEDNRHSKNKLQIGESGDNAAINNHSIESISVTFPWNRLTQRRNIYQESTDLVRDVPSAAFFLCTCAIVLLVCSLATCTVCSWSMIYRIPFVVVTEGNTQLMMNVSSFISALLNIPAFWLTWIAHNNKKNYVFLPLLIIILVFAVGLSSASITMGLLTKRQLKLDKERVPAVFLPCPFRDTINKTLYQTAVSYENNHRYKHAWDLTQIRLKCCGIKNYSDWTSLNIQIPNSCYVDLTKKLLYRPGCLDRLGIYLHCESQLITVFIFLAFVGQLITVLVASLVYF